MFEKVTLVYLHRDTEDAAAEGDLTPTSVMESKDQQVLSGNWFVDESGWLMYQVSFLKHFSTCDCLQQVANQIVLAEQSMCSNSTESLQPTREIKAFYSLHCTITGKALTMLN